jgi:hypothetical protein
MAGRGNTATLRPFAKGDKRARDAGRAGGLRSAQVRAEERALAEWAAQIGGLTAQRRGGMSNAEAVVRKLYKMAIHGSLAASKLLMEMMGELPKGKGTLAMLDGGKLPLLIIDRPRMMPDG